MQVPFFTISGVLMVNPYGIADMTLPAMEVSAVGGAIIKKTFPSITASISAHYDPIVQTDLSIPVLKLSSSAIVSPLGDVSSDLPILTINASAYWISDIDMDVTLPKWRLSSVALNGASGLLSEELPMFAMDATAYWIKRAEVNVTLPSLWSEIVIGGEITGYCVNLDNFSFSKYTAYPYNSLASFNGKFIGFGGTGIYELSGESDDSKDIAWKLRTGQLDMLKNRLRYVWLSGKFIDPITLIVEDPSGNQYEYEGTPYSEAEDEIRVKVGKGINSRYLIIELSGLDHFDVSIDRIRVFGMPGKDKR